ncbi:malonic semialdehyde reductase [Silicimonas sp. MF1-12-2]|uniref:malonic semialdehyde reductase n=1 Tax=Silicimonas sp. MF1-12-2 TaxID=3384793 RepID=UPI0039B5BFB9
MSSAMERDLVALREKAQEVVRDLRARKSTLDDESIDLILREARSHYAWSDRPVAREILEVIYEIVAAGPTSMNTCPGRFVFVTSEEGKARLAKALKPANVVKMQTAPVTVIVAHDLEFWTHLPFLFPHEDRRHLYEGKPAFIESTAFRNGTLQGAYFMIAARALGLDVGAMSGFSNEVVDEEFFAGTSHKSNFLINLGYADETALFQKLPRFTFDEVCSFA